MGSDSDDLARTATAVVAGQPAETTAKETADGATPLAPIEPVGPTLGKYRLERELGSGGMGVVHAAFDPDLERFIALKVLRSRPSGAQGGEAQKRLLREARAMAKLAHPNVVTVHEVGSVGGRAFVAMELIEGETLADWLAAGKRSEQEIVQAFTAAGRGLAAAHRAGMVHRDFKPHNVLRSFGGRIVVTDFGLARHANDEADAPSSRQTPTSLGSLTVTGNVLGTPAYMAPEQWAGGTLTPATDQFAFCVALWEAIVGERPFRAPTLERLREAVERGPTAHEASRLPRHLRKALCRGVDPDPAKRWPSMDALLDAMAPRRRTVAIAAVAGVVAVAGVGAVLLVANRSKPATCPAPIATIDAVWSADAMRAKGRAIEAELIDADAKAWSREREQACSGALDDGAPSLEAALEQRATCFDGVLARLDIVAHAIGALPQGPAVDPGEYLIDPAVCTRPRPPRLDPRPSPDMRAVLSAFVANTPVPAAQAPCASALAHQAAAFGAQDPSSREALEQEAGQDLQNCEDQRVHAEIAVAEAQLALDSYLGAAVGSKLKLAQLAVDKVAQADALADLDRLRTEIARRAQNLDEAIRTGEAATAGYAKRGRTAMQLANEVTVLNLRAMRASAEDLATIEKRFAAARATAVAKLGEAHPVVHDIDGAIGTRMFAMNDLDGAHARLEAIRREIPFETTQPLVGRVLDSAGAPVAGARVVAGPEVTGDAKSIALPFPDQAPWLRYATTSTNGEFSIANPPPRGAIIAERDKLRSRPIAFEGARTVELRLAKTTHLAGHVELGGEPASRAFVTVDDLGSPAQYQLIAPVTASGDFELDGVPYGKVRVTAKVVTGAASALARKIVEVADPVAEVRLAVERSHRVVHVIVRSEAAARLDNARVFVVAGAHAGDSLAKLAAELGTVAVGPAQPVGADAPPEVRAQRGDLYATMKQVPEGDATACAFAMPANNDPGELVARKADRVMVACEPIQAGKPVVTVNVRPWPRE